MQGSPHRPEQKYHQHPRGHPHAPQPAKPTRAYNPRHPERTLLYRTVCDHVFPRLPVRQWVLSMPKRIRYYLQRDKGALNAALRIFLRVVQQSLVSVCPGAANADPASLHIGAVAFIQPT